MIPHLATTPIPITSHIITISILLSINLTIIIFYTELLQNTQITQFLTQSNIGCILQFDCQRQQFSIMNYPQKIKNSPIILKEDRSSIQNTVKMEKQKPVCPICLENSSIICYGCCYEFSCQSCYSQQHYAKCTKKFNKYKISLSEGVTVEDEHRFKKHARKNKQNFQCQRCFQGCQAAQHCDQCKVNLCSSCSDEVHSFGKFRHHVRNNVCNSPLKHKKMDTFLTESDELQQAVMKKSTKQNIDKGQYGIKAKQKVSKINSTPQTKKGKSVVKTMTRNQENSANAATVGREKNHHLVSIEKQILPTNIASSKRINEPAWQFCQNHHKLRTVLTQNFDLLCVQCYDKIKGQTYKLKTIDICSLINKQVNTEQIKLNFQTLLNEFHIKMKETQSEFANYRQVLLSEFTKKEELLVERYKSNLNCVQKWQNLYIDNIKKIISICKDSLEQRRIICESQIDFKSQSKMEKVLNLKNFLALQQINQCKKQYYNQQEQYQFRVNQINSQYYEDMLKNFSFVRRKIDNQQGNSHQKSLSKMHQSNQLRQSRISNSSFRTDRKGLNRDESFHKSNYCELSSNSNLIKRSMSKEIKDQITKDISQKILFTNDNNMVKSDKKNSLNGQNVKRFQKQMKNSQYFFQNIQDQTQKTKVKIKKQPLELTNYSFKDIKYVNLQNFLTQKLQKIYDQKKEKGGAKIDEKAVLFSNDMEISTQLVDLQQQAKLPTSDSRMTYSIDTTSIHSHLNKIPQTTSVNHSIASSTQNSLHNANKNKRKSDYMEMRDRLRKPNAIHKISK